MPKIHIFSLPGDKDEKARALRDAQAIAAVVPDPDTPRRATEPARPATPADPTAALPAANASPAAVTLAALLDTLAPDDLRALLAEEEARRAAIAAQQETARQRALESEAARAERERNAQEYARLKPELDALSAEIAQTAAQFQDERDALLSLAGQLNALILQHGRLFGRLQTVDGHKAGEIRHWERPYRWSDADAITRQALERAQAGD